MRRLLIPSVALVWGLQVSFLNPVLALLLVSLFQATPGQVGTLLALYNASGFASALVIPVWADRHRSYLPLMAGCGTLTVALALALAASRSLTPVAIALVVVGGPAGVGLTLFFAHLKHAGATTRDVLRTRALFSFAWVAGPPAGTFLMGWLGDRSVLWVVAGFGVLNVATISLLSRSSRPLDAPDVQRAPAEPDQDLSRVAVVLIMVAFVLLQATNAATVATMTLFVTRHLGLPVGWAGIALGVAAAAEVPAMLLIGRLSERHSLLGLIAVGCAAGIGYYAAMVVVGNGWLLVAVQVLNAWFFATVAGLGLSLFQRIIARPGLASGLYMNTRRVGAIVAGPMIALAAVPSFGYSAIFAASAVMTAVALVIVVLVARHPRPGPEGSGRVSVQEPTLRDGG